MPAITPERILEEMRGARLVSHISIPVSGPKFNELLKDPNFRNEAMAIVKDKLDAIVQGRIKFAKGPNTKQMAHQAWGKLLKGIKTAELGSGIV
jgi:hypothetical protein